MNPLLMEALGSIVRWLLAGAAGWLVQHGIWTQAQSQTYIMAVALAVLSLGWSLWQKYKSRVHFLTALEVPAGSDEEAVKRRVANGAGAPLIMLLVAAGLSAGVLVSSCAGMNKLVITTSGEHIAVVSVHAVIQAEASAFNAGAYDNAHHQTYVAALLKVTQSEKALNDALMTWNAASGQPMPQVVSIAVQSLQRMLSDVAPFIPANSNVRALVDAAKAAIAALTGGK